MAGVFVYRDHAGIGGRCHNSLGAQIIDLGVWQFYVGHAAAVADDAKGGCVVFWIEAPPLLSAIRIQCHHYVLSSAEVDAVAYLNGRGA